MKKILLLIGAGLMMAASPAMARSHADCQGLKTELRAMQKAQSQIMMSLVNNHESFASSMEEYSLAVGKAPATVSKEMNKSAQAFRTRGSQGKQIAEKLNKATGDLIARVASCLE
jgi:hypothetical protein